MVREQLGPRPRRVDRHASATSGSPRTACRTPGCWRPSAGRSTAGRRTRAGWVFTVARRRALDRLARESSRTRRRQRDAGADRRRAARSTSSSTARSAGRPGIEDDRLRLIFTCCHPALDLDGRIALTLRSVAWLTTEEIAAAFGVPVADDGATARARQGQDQVERSCPTGCRPAPSSPTGWRACSRVVYLVFNEAYLSARPADAGAGRPRRRGDPARTSARRADARRARGARAAGVDARPARPRRGTLRRRTATWC